MALILDGTTGIGIDSGTQPLDSASLNAVIQALIPTGTKMLFQQTAAPTGWTKDTTHDNKALRVVSGSASSGGTVAFTTAFASKAVSGTVGSTTLTTAQIPAHEHDVQGPTGHSLASQYGANSGRFATFSFSPSSVNSGNTYGDRNWYSVASGGSGSHNHSFTGTAIDLAVSYVDLIIATKN